MGNMFSYDSKLMNTMTLLGDLMVLNILGIITSLPIITAGASWTAMYSITIKLVRKENISIIPEYFQAFRKSFLQSTIIWGMLLLYTFIIVADYHVIRDSGLQFSTIVPIAIIAVTSIVIITSVSIFMLIARFENTLFNTIKNAFLFSAISFPKTILSILFFCIWIYLLLYSNFISIPLAVLIGISFPNYFISWIFKDNLLKLEK